MPKLVIEKLSFAYQDTPVIKKLSYSFEPGTPYVLTAPSGSGKTTLLHLIAGLLTPTEGNITGGGMEKCALAFQEPRLFPSLSAWENASLTASPEDAKRFLTDLGFTESDLHKYPPSLSGGMQQRVSLARAFLSGRPILLLDEPSRGLDAALRERLAEKIKEAARTKLVIAVSHSEEDSLLWGAKAVNL